MDSPNYQINPFGNGKQTFNYLKHRYAFLYTYLKFLQKKYPRCHSLIKNKHGPYQFLSCCSQMIFFKEGFKCMWDESKIAKNGYGKKNLRGFRLNQRECINLMTLGKAFVENIDLHIGEFANEFTSLLLSPNIASKCDNFYMFDDIVKLKNSVQKYLRTFSEEDTEKLKLKVYHGFNLIPGYMKTIVKDKIEYEDIGLSSCDDNWFIYALSLAAECIRSIAVLMYPYIWKKDGNFLTWDVNSSQFKYKIYLIEYVCLELIKLVQGKNVTNDCKQRLLCMLGIMKDTSIRLGLGLNLFSPLDEYKQPVTHFMKNDYLYTSEVYAICTYIKKNSLYEKKLGREFWSTESLLKLKKSKDCFDHLTFHIMSQEMSGCFFENEEISDFGSNSLQLQSFCKELNVYEQGWMLSSRYLL